MNRITRAPRNAANNRPYGNAEDGSETRPAYTDADRRYENRVLALSWLFAVLAIAIEAMKAAA